MADEVGGRIYACSNTAARASSGPRGDSRQDRPRTDVHSSDRKNDISPTAPIAKELHWAAVAGMTLLQATATPPEKPGSQTPTSGQVRYGCDADLNAVVGNPPGEVEILTSPGGLVKSPAGPKASATTLRSTPYGGRSKSANAATRDHFVPPPIM